MRRAEVAALVALSLLALLIFRRHMHRWSNLRLQPTYTEIGGKYAPFERTHSWRAQSTGPSSANTTLTLPESRRAVMHAPGQPADGMNSTNWRPGQPLPFPLRNCSAALFRHLGKTGGSSIQAIFRRNEQLGVSSRHGNPLQRSCPRCRFPT